MMAPFKIDPAHFLEPWCAFDKDFSIQLHRELSADHVLYGAVVRTIAHREDNDDVLFEVTDREYQFAKVHLTWQGMQPDARWPRTTFYKDWNEVYENVIIPDHTEYIS